MDTSQSLQFNNSALWMASLAMATQLQKTTNDKLPVSFAIAQCSIGSEGG